MKTCTRCAAEKPETDFYDGYTRCKACVGEQHAEYIRTPSGQRASRRKRLKFLYNITLEQYEQMLEEQDGHCALCPATTPGGRFKNFSVDHDHRCCPGKRSCGKCVRALLCLRCNNSLGWFETHREAVMAHVDRHPFR